MDMNLLELLLSKDIVNLKEEIVISNRIGIDNKFLIRALNNDEIANIRKRCLTINKKGIADFDLNKFQEVICITGCLNPNFNDANYINKAGAGDSAGLLKKLLLPGEIDTLYNNISRLSGFDEDLKESIEQSKK